MVTLVVQRAKPYKSNGKYQKLIKTNWHDGSKPIFFVCYSVCTTDRGAIEWWL